MVDNVGELFTSVPEGLELAYKDLTTFATPDNVANMADFVPVLGPEVRGIQIAVAETTGYGKENEPFYEAAGGVDLAVTYAALFSGGTALAPAEAGGAVARQGLRETLFFAEEAEIAAQEAEIASTLPMSASVGETEAAAKGDAALPVMVGWSKGGNAITGLQLIKLGSDTVNRKLDANKQQVDNLKARLDAVARRDQALIDAAIAKRDADDRKKTPEKEQQRLDGYAALKDAATRRQEDATPAPMTPAPHTDDAPVQVHNKPEVTMDPDLVPDAATPSAVVPQLDLRGPATIVLAGVVLYGAYSAYTLA